MDKTTIEVTDETWRRLNRLKNPGQTFDEVVAELLDEQFEATETCT